MGWTIDDHKASATEAIDRGLMQGNLEVLSEVPEPLQSTQHQARVMSLSVLNATAGPDATLGVAWEPWAYYDEEPPVEPPVEPPPVEPPTEKWPDEFMSYPRSEPIVLNGASNQVIEYLSFDSVYAPARPITLENCDNITIRRIDTRHCTMGLVYALNCTNIKIEYCRVENIASEMAGYYLGQPGPAAGGRPTFTNTDWGGGHANFYQFNKVNGFEVRHLKGRYGNTEDVFSHYQSSNGVVEDLHFEGGIRTDQPTSDGSPSTMWTSQSGTFMINTDDGGHDVFVSDCVAVNCGQTLCQLGGQNNTYKDCIGIGEGGTSQPWNNGAQTWGWAGENCQNLTFENYRGLFYRSNGVESPFWWGCSIPSTPGSDFSDHSLDVEDYRVRL